MKEAEGKRPELNEEQVNNKTEKVFEEKGGG